MVKLNMALLGLLRLWLSNDDVLVADAELLFAFTRQSVAAIDSHRTCQLLLGAWHHNHVIFSGRVYWARVIHARKIDPRLRFKRAVSEPLATTQASVSI